MIHLIKRVAVGLSIAVGIIVGIQLDLIGWWQYQGTDLPRWKHTRAGAVTKTNKLTGHIYVFVPKAEARAFYGKNKAFWKRMI